MSIQRTRFAGRSLALVAVAAFAALMMGQAGSQPSGKDSPLPQRRVAAARLACELLVIEPPKSGEARASTEDTYLWSRRWMEAEQDAAPDRPTSLAAAEAHLARMTELVHRAKRIFEAGQTSAANVACAEFYLLDAEWSAAKYRAK